MNLFCRDDEARPLPQMPMTGLRMHRGESFHHVGAGGGGYGNPFERDPRLVLEDVLDEKVSLAVAERDYGVVIDPIQLTIDETKSAVLRTERVGKACP